MGLVHLLGVMVVFIQENLLLIIYMVKEYINGLINVNTQVIGKKIRWMVMEYLLGKMVANIKDNIWMIKNMDLVNFFGQMVECIKDIGKMVDNMEKEFIEVVMVLKEKVNGKMEKKLNG